MKPQTKYNLIFLSGLLLLFTLIGMIISISTMSKGNFHNYEDGYGWSIRN